MRYIEKNINDVMCFPPPLLLLISIWREQAWHHRLPWKIMEVNHWLSCLDSQNGERKTHFSLTEHTAQLSK